MTFSRGRGVLLDPYRVHTSPVVTTETEDKAPFELEAHCPPAPIYRVGTPSRVCGKVSTYALKTDRIHIGLPENWLICIKKKAHLCIQYKFGCGY